MAAVGILGKWNGAVGNFNAHLAALPAIDWRTVSPGYFDTLKIPLLRGRDFTDADTGNAPDVMIVSRATAVCTSAATLPRSRPETPASTAIRRLPASRRIAPGPNACSTEASWPSGILVPS